MSDSPRWNVELWVPVSALTWPSISGRASSLKKTYKPIIISRDSLLGKTIPTRSWAMEKKDGQIKASSSHHSSTTRTVVARHTSQTRYLQELSLHSTHHKHATCKNCRCTAHITNTLPARTVVARHTSQTRYLQELQSAAALCCASRQTL